MKNKEKIAVVILHFGNENITKQCLDSFANLKQSNFIVDVVLVDNNSNSNTNIKRHSIIKKYLSNTSNKGYAAGNNVALSYIYKEKYDYCLFINNDTVVRSDFLEKLLEVAKLHKEFIAGPVIEHKVKGKIFYDYGGIVDWSKCQPKHINKTFLWQYTQPIERDFVSGCCMLLPVRVIKKLQGFDESFFMYLEDVDLCLRAKKLGISSYVIPQSIIFHLGSKSASNFLKIWQSWKNSFRLIFRYCPKQFIPNAIIFNSWFYPALFVQWQVKNVKQNIYGIIGRNPYSQ